MVKVEVETETEEQVREGLLVQILCLITVRQMRFESFQRLYQVPSLQKLQEALQLKIYRNMEKQGRLYFT